MAESIETKKPSACSVAWPLMGMGAGPAGAPGGKPNAGSGGKMPATISPNPKVPMRSAPIVPPFCPFSLRRTPVAHATASSPVRRKLVIWIHPRSPRLSWLMAFWRMLYPDRVNAWMMATPKNNGPAMMPQASRALVNPWG